MRLHVRSVVLASALAAALAPAVTTPASAADAMQLTDLGPAFSPPAGLGADSPLTALGRITVANASQAAHTYALVDLVTNQTTFATLAPGTAHTYLLATSHTYAVEQVNGTARALVASI